MSVSSWKNSTKVWWALSERATLSEESDRGDADTDCGTASDDTVSDDEEPPFLSLIMMNGSISVVPIHSPTLTDIKIHAAILLRTLYPCLEILDCISGRIIVNTKDLPPPQGCAFAVGRAIDDMAVLPPRQLKRVMWRHAGRGDHHGVMLCAQIAADHHNAQSAGNIVRHWIVECSLQHVTPEEWHMMRNTLASSWVDLCENGQEARHNNMLIDAAGTGDERLVVALLDARATIDAVNANGDTALMKATRAGYLEVVRQLLQYGADVSIKNKHGETAIGPASRGGHRQIAVLLLESGAVVPPKSPRRKAAPKREGKRKRRKESE